MAHLQNEAGHFYNVYLTNMIYGYIRVSTEKQTVANQRYEIETFCKEQNLKVNGWIEETISGSRSYKQRELGKLLMKAKKGDVIICSELSRLGRSLFMIMEILSSCLDSGCNVWTIKEGYRLGNDIPSKVLAFAFSLSAEIERNLISVRTKEALALRKAEGKQLGRPEGRLNSHHKLDWKDDLIRGMLEKGCSYTEIASECNVSRKTIIRWMERHSN